MSTCELSSRVYESPFMSTFYFTDLFFSSFDFEIETTYLVQRKLMNLYSLVKKYIGAKNKF